MTSTDTKDVERIDHEREIETTLQVSATFITTIRTLVRAGDQIAACRMLDEPIKVQYIDEEVHVTVVRILYPEKRAGADYMLTPTDVIG
ncbi:hypothetical protein BKN37_13680 [Mycobacterium talmoniae]|uniref:Uncharacterized protein n=1 Tax=Mycobacterium talmoniae TaxID=1858794 RepID=A0A1S1NIP5_9MYCO|nr:hypothetical protein BKN37_13680 [Mycobacterium talmoniae]